LTKQFLLLNLLVISVKYLQICDVIQTVSMSEKQRGWIHPWNSNGARAMIARVAVSMQQLFFLSTLIYRMSNQGPQTTGLEIWFRSCL